MAGEFYISNLVGDFDYQSYLDKLKEIKMVPVNSLKKQEVLFSAKLQAVSQIHSRLSSLLSIVQNLSSTEIFQNLKATSSDTSVLTVAATGNPTIQNYDITVSQVAKSNTFLISPISTITSPDFTFTEDGSLVINYKEDGTTKSFSIDYKGKTLKEIVETLNEAGIFRASLINVGTASSPDYKLLISPLKTGLDNVITGIDDTLNPGDDSLGVFSEDSSKTKEVESAQNAILTINGVQIESNYNELSSTIDGLKLSLKGAGSATVSVEKDFSQIKNSLEKLLKGYNDLKSTISKLTGKGGPLQGEFSLHSVERAIFNEIIDKLGKFGVIDTIGDADTTKGELKLNEENLNKVIDNDEFKNAIKQLGSVLEDYLNTYDVNYISLENTYREKISQLQKREKFMTDLINKEIESMRLRFARLQTYLSEMKGVQQRIENFMLSFKSFQNSK